MKRSIQRCSKWTTDPKKGTRPPNNATTQKMRFFAKLRIARVCASVCAKGTQCLTSTYRVFGRKPLILGSRIYPHDEPTCGVWWLRGVEYDVIPDHAVNARRFLFCIPTDRLTDIHFSTLVKGLHISEVLLLVQQ